MGSVRKSIFISETNQDVLEWFEGVKSPSEAVCQLIRESTSKDREMELLKQLINQQAQHIKLLESMVQGGEIIITKTTKQEDMEEVVEEDLSVSSEEADALLSVFQ